MTKKSVDEYVMENEIAPGCAEVFVLYRDQLGRAAVGKVLLSADAIRVRGALGIAAEEALGQALKALEIVVVRAGGTGEPH